MYKNKKTWHTAVIQTQKEKPLDSENPGRRQKKLVLHLQYCVCNIWFNRLLWYMLYAQQQEQDPTNLYISNLPVSMDEQELESMLKSFGQVISTRILRDANGTSRGVGFARSVCST